MKSIDETRALLGKHVAVTLDEKVIVKGQLLAFGEYGDFVIVDPEDPADVHYCWPMLEIEEVLS